MNPQLLVARVNRALMEWTVVCTMNIFGTFLSLFLEVLSVALMLAKPILMRVGLV